MAYVVLIDTTPSGTNVTDEVRALLGVDQYDLPDSAINLMAFRTRADNQIVAYVANNSTVTAASIMAGTAGLAADKQHLVMAALCYLAAGLATTLNARLHKSEKGAEFSVENNPVDWDAKKHELEQNAWYELGQMSVFISPSVPQVMASGATRLAASQPALYPGVYLNLVW